MTWISWVAGWLTTMSARKATNSAEAVPRRGFAQHLAVFGVERGVQRQRTMAVVLKAVPLGPVARQRQHRVLAVERLDRRLLVDAEHRRMGRRVHIQSNDIGRLALEFGIVRGHLAVAPLRLQSVLCPDPRYHHVRDRQHRTQLGAVPLARLGRFDLPFEDFHRASD